MTSVDEYIAAVEEPRRAEIEKLHLLISKAAPKLTPSVQSGMIGYGRYHYKYASGREGDSPVIALASRKGYISVYICGTGDLDQSIFPKANIGKGCIRFKKLGDVDLKALERVVKQNVKQLAKATESEKRSDWLAG